VVYNGVALFGVFPLGEEIKISLKKLSSYGILNSKVRLLGSKSKQLLELNVVMKTMTLAFAKIGSLVGGSVGLAIVLILFYDPTHSVAHFSSPSLDKFLLMVLIFFLSSIFGAFGGALVGIGTPQSIVFRFGTYIDAGGVLFSVKVDNDLEEENAKRCFEDSGAHEVALLDEEKTWQSIRKNQLLLFKPSQT
jgi:hypothetical protein